MRIPKLETISTERHYSIKEVALMFEISRTPVDRAVKKGILISYRVFGKTFITGSTLRKYIEDAFKNQLTLV